MKYNAIKRAVPLASAKGVLVFVLFLVCALLFTSATGLFGASQAFANPNAQRHRQKAEEARKKAAEADKRAEALKKEIKDLDDEAARFAEQAAALAPDIQTATEKNNALTKELNALQAQANELKASIKETKAELSHQQDLLNGRANQTYRHGNEIYLSLLFGAQNLEDLITRTDYVMQVLAHNSKISEDLKRTTRTLETEKAQLDEVLIVAEEKQQEAAANETKLRTLQAQNKSAEANANALQNQKGNLMQQTKKNAERLRVIAAEEEALAQQVSRELSSGGSASTGSGSYSGKMTWPVPGFSRISSPYGYRSDPFTGASVMHHGVDIAGPGINGAKIVSAGPGKVVSAGVRGGYGYTVIVDHGNGVSTLYAHMQAGSITVSHGQQVDGGQQIGRVGSTGYSTGPHLHWEVRVNGASRNPLTF